MTGLLECWLLNRTLSRDPLEWGPACPVHGWPRASRTWVASSQDPLSTNPNIPGGLEAGGCLATSLLPLTPMYVLLRGVLAQAGQGQDGHMRPREGLERGQKASFSQRGYLTPRGDLESGGHSVVGCLLAPPGVAMATAWVQWGQPYLRGD